MSTHSGLKQVHATTAAPDLCDEQAEWFPLTRAGRLEVRAEWHQLAHNVVAGAPFGPQEIVVVGRRGGPEILGSEVARLAHLTGLALTIKQGRC
jgi:hypothetical protein